MHRDPVPAVESAPTGEDPRARLAAWRAQGADRADPVHFRFLEALARRSALHSGGARHLLDQRLAQLVAAYAQLLPAGSSGPAQAAAAAGAEPLAASPLARLLAGLDEAPGAARGDVRAAPVPQLKALRDFRSTWSRLRAEQRLNQSRAQVPHNAGPLNSQHLLHQSLSLMCQVSPQYLECFTAYADALLALDALQGGRMAAAAPAAPAVAPARGRRKR